MIVRSCVPRWTATTPRCPIAHPVIAGRRRIHRSSPTQAEFPDHYATLDIPPTASAADIKKKFYSLSKSHHPDLHPDDPDASQKFVRISEAYATLGSPERRARYDRDLSRQSPAPSTSSSGPGGRGSYSSASASGPGGRPASGLSRRRTQFRGPPPSFYRSGGWGTQGEKRGEAARKASHSHEAQGRAGSNPSGGDEGGVGAGGTAEPGMGPGGFTAGFDDDDVPHFDRRAHAQTHSEIERTRHRARRKRATPAEESEAGTGSSVLFNFFLITGTLGLIYGATKLVIGTGHSSAETGKKKTATMDGEEK